MKNNLLFKSLIIAGVISITPVTTFAETYLTKDQAQQVLWQKNDMTKIDVILTKEQMKSIAKASDVRVRDAKMKIWKVENGGWFILDEVIGKHENIDIAVALTKDGKVKGVEVLQYRETYGYEIREPKWLAQFLGKTHHEILRLDKQIKNISGATLSCRHVTDGVNRLLHTWEQVLRHL